MSDKISLSRGYKKWLRAAAKLWPSGGVQKARQQAADTLDATLKYDAGLDAGERHTPEARRDEFYEAIRNARLPPL